jgi:hypothetical protein
MMPIWLFGMTGVLRASVTSTDAALARSEGMDAASHSLRWKPRSHGIPIEERLIDGLARHLDNP